MNNFQINLVFRAPNVTSVGGYNLISPLKYRIIFVTCSNTARAVCLGPSPSNFLPTTNFVA